MQIIEAHVVDATHLELMLPIQVPSGARVLVSIATPEADKEHGEWVKMSLQRLQSAYDPDEPDYSLARLQIPNSEFEP
ncbi:MAG: hypothetical protein WA705_11395 [Candidatus Ozemobacteraceae bacterium]